MSKANKCIGIISWLPNRLVRGADIRKQREDTLTATFLKLSEIFPEIDILVIAQSLGNYEPPKITNKLILYKYENGLGIVPARRKLREAFIKSDYDYLIMSDDDLNIIVDSGEDYLNQIDNNFGKVGLVKRDTKGFAEDGGSLVLFAIPKEVYKKIELPRHESYDYFEDLYLVGICKKYFDTFLFNGVYDKTLAQGASPSTWLNDGSGIYNIKLLTNNTNTLLNNYCPT